jgi:hypothetical protein
MSWDKRADDRRSIDSMMQEFLDKGGKIVQCPPGSSEAVVYKKGSFKRRAAQKPAETENAAAGEAAAGNAAPAENPAGEARPEGAD